MTANKPIIRSTTILTVLHNGHVVMAGDGQVTVGQTIMKQNAKKVRKLHNDTILAGFAGSASDALALFTRFEEKLEKFNGNLTRSAVELGKDWRMDKVLRRLEAILLAADKNSCLLVSGTGDIIEPDDGIVGIGSGGSFALAAAKALAQNTDMPARQIAEEAMRIAASICIYTNSEIVVEEL